MIFFLSAQGLESGIRPLQDDPAAPEVKLLRYKEVLGRSHLPRGTYIFTGVERLNTTDLIEATTLYRRLEENGCRVLNDPGRVRTRFALLRTLYNAGINPFNAYLADEGARPSRFPVFIRIASDHTGSRSELIGDQDELNSAIEGAVVAGFPRSALIIVEYAAEPVRPGVFRKSSVYKVGEQFIRDVWWFGGSWHVKGDREGLADEALYKEELEAIRENRFDKSLADAFAVASIGYGRLDFSLVEGRPCIYEINTYPILYGPRPDPVPDRTKSLELRWARLIAAFHELDSGDSSVQDMVDVAGTSIEALRQAKALSQSLRHLNLKLSREHARRGNLSEALAAAEAEVAANPDDVKALAYLSRSFERYGRTDDAIAVATRVVAISPRRAKERLYLAELLLKSGRYEPARTLLLKGIALRTDNWQMHFLLAQVCSRLADNSAALESANRAAELASDATTKATCLSFIRQLLTKQGSIDDAVAVAMRVLELNPERNDDRTHLINLLRQSGRFEEARAQLLNALAVQGEQWRLYYLLSHVSKKVGDDLAALDAATRAVKLAPDEAGAADWLRRLTEEKALREEKAVSEEKASRKKVSRSRGVRGPIGRTAIGRWLIQAAGGSRFAGSFMKASRRFR